MVHDQPAHNGTIVQIGPCLRKAVKLSKVFADFGDLCKRSATTRVDHEYNFVIHV